MNKENLDKKAQKAERKAAKAAERENKKAAKLEKKNAKIAKKENKLSAKTAKKEAKRLKKENKKLAQTITSNKKKKLKRKTRKKITIFLIIALLLILLSIIGIYLLKGYQNRNQFFHGVMINNMNVTGKTVEEVEQMMKEKTESYVLTIIGRDDTTVTVSTEDINYKYISDGSIAEYFNTQKWWLWGLNYLKIDRDRHEISVDVEYDETLLHNLIDSWDFMQAENQKDPVDAHLQHQNGSYVIVDEFYGNRINSEIFHDAVVEAINSSRPDLLIEDTGAYSNPKIFADDPILNENLKTLNEKAKCTITYTLPNGETNSVTPEILLTWLATDAEGRYYINEALLTEKIKTYVDELNKVIQAVETKEVTFMGKLGEEQTVKNYRKNTWKLDVEKEIAQLTADLKANTDVTREPMYSDRLLTPEGKIADTYVEIDMSAQHLWYFVDGEVVVESDIVSGTYNNRERRTPEGLYQLAYKQRDRVLLGAPDEEGKPSYESPVDYWMPFNGSIGMHDADNWRSKYGGTIYKYSGSHGCINMPRKKAKALYEIIEKGCPVVCYY
uniref:L,D-transpeptidase family protein n=1 Tax=Agathobacter sp. TaxID=2021311 RepID=UPI0040572611